ncbi:MAG: four helix bundle protein [Bacteroidota bacterium]
MNSDTEVELNLVEEESENYFSESNTFQFEKLSVYQKSLLFIDFIYKLTNNFPKEEEYRIKSQFIRAANSIALNIAEGTGGTKNEFKNFLRISKRSIRECVVCATVCRMQNFITIDQETESRKKLIELSKMINGLIKSIS